MAHLFLPSLDIRKGDIGGHVQLAAVAAPTAGTLSIRFTAHHAISSRISFFLSWESLAS
ncbi:MAG TPA: hypothetical protein VMT71_16025 [Syntrophorhabdales bacterium]|nr:hypothetical protein [Syntrophorhabdales bacterium]